MGARAKSGAFDLGSATSAAITIESGFGSPTAVIYWGSWNGSDGSKDAHAAPCIGFCSGSGEQGTVAAFCQDGQGTSSTGQRCASDASLILLDPVNANLEGEFAYSSFSSPTDGFTISKVTSPASDKRINYLAFGGDVQAKFLEFTPSSVADLSAQADFGFVPDVILAIGDHNSFDDTDNPDAFISYGCATNESGGIIQKCACYVNRTGVSTHNGNSWFSTNRIYKMLTKVGGSYVEYEVTDFEDGSGLVEITTRAASFVALKLGLLGLKFPSGEECKLHQYTAPSTNGGTVVLSTATTPDVAVVCQANNTTTDAVATGENDKDWPSFGAVTVDHAGSRVAGSSSKNGSGSSVDKSITEDDTTSNHGAVYTMVEGSGNDLLIGGYTSRTSSSMTFTYANGNNTRYGWALTIGKEVVPPGDPAVHTLVRRLTSPLRRM